MSTDWNIKCLDCGDVHGFDDANHQDELMAHLCKHADAIANLAPLLADDHSVEFRTYYGSIDAAWFVKHRGHKLWPVSEYGDLLGQCAEYVKCTCGSMKRCTRDAGHAGSHGVQP